jgi:hypothetical protein
MSLKLVSRYRLSVDGALQYPALGVAQRIGIAGKPTEGEVGHGLVHHAPRCGIQVARHGPTI